ncbi:MAG: hypothetical protein CM15mP6_4440 [Methanobacteriota archaeon]|nr:MAG: hypothetical protein CM15mP6_4440 [Euryarchaeota archaeon]
MDWKVGKVTTAIQTGEVVTFTIEIADTVHQVEVMGNTWETEWVDLTSRIGWEYDQVIIDGRLRFLGQSGKCTTIQTSIDTSNRNPRSYGPI